MSDPIGTEKKYIISLQETIGRLEKKIADLEDEFEVSKKSGRSEAYIIALKNEIIELRREKNILLERQKVSATRQNLNNYAFPTKKSELFPCNGIGLFVIEREILVNEIIKNVSINKVSNYYFRGPRGSGKSFMLNLLGKRLLELNKKVFFIEHAGDLKNLSRDLLKEFDESLKEPAYILIDEVHENTSDPLWDYLLKKAVNLVVIGVGIPHLDGRSPAFMNKFAGDFFLFKSEDLDIKVIEKFEELLNDGLTSSSVVNTRTVVENTLSWVLSYTGGHTYPFLKLSEYLLKQRKQECIDSNLESIVCCALFFDLEISKEIIARSFQLSHDVREASHKIFTQGIIDGFCEDCLEKSSLWNSDKNWFISNFLVFHLFSIKKKIEFGPLDLQKIIEIGLEDLSEIHFSQMLNDLSVERYENSIGYYIGYKMASIKNLFISPQQQHNVPKVDPSKRGTAPTIDFYVNGNIDCYIEIVKNSSILKEHFEKFESVDGMYALRKNKEYVILDIQLTESKPYPITPKYKNRLYTFIKSKNALYCGDTVVKSNVSKFLPAYREFSSSPQLSRNLCYQIIPSLSRILRRAVI